MEYLNKLPLTLDIETKKVLKESAKAHKELAELKGVARLIPNENFICVISIRVQSLTNNFQRSPSIP